jgi:hypothetical protein
MEPDPIAIVGSLKTPRAAGVAGIVFAILLTVALFLLLRAAPSESNAPQGWLTDKAADFALQLVPFAGIAFLWLIGVVRDRIGASEDRFFATVFLGSGILFVALLFASAGIAQGVLEDAAEAPSGSMSDTFELCRRISGVLLHTYAMRMAAVFMISTSTIGLRTQFMPRWLAFSGFAIALILLLGIGVTRWVELAFPFWVVLFSLDTLVVRFKEEKPLVYL